MGCQLFKPLVERKCRIPDGALQTMVYDLNQKSVEEATKILAILNNVSEYQPLPSDVLSKVVISLGSIEENVIEQGISILENMLRHPSEYYNALVGSSVSHLQLLTVVKSYGLSLGIKTKSINFLKSVYDKSGACFSMEFFGELIPLFAHENTIVRSVSLELIKNQIPKLQLYIFNKNIIFEKLIQAVLGRLHDEHQQSLVLQVLRDVAKYGYSFSKETLTSVADLLYILEDNAARVYIYEVLSSQNNLLSNETKTIYEIELLARLYWNKANFRKS